MKTTNPEIRIKYAWLLRQNVSEAFNKFHGDGKPLMSHQYYLNVVDNYKKAWKPYEKKILDGIQKITGLQFRQNIIDVHIAPWFGAFSDPLVIGVIYNPDKFIDTLTHELIHRLLTDNQTAPYDTDFVAEWKELFGDNYSYGVVVHIPVHAIHKAIYLDILKEPKRLERDIEETKTVKSKDYIKTWNYIEKNDYKEIIDKLNKSYTKLSKQKTS